MSEPSKKVKKIKSFDPKDLTDEQISKVFSDERIWKHERFKELAELAKEAKEIKKQQEIEKTKKLEEEKKFEELLQIERKKVEELTKQTSQIKVETAIQTEAVKRGIVDSDAALKLVDRDLIKIGDNGELTGVKEAIESLATSKPYLVDSTKANLGGGTPPNNNTGIKIKLSDAQNAEYYSKHSSEVDEAFRTNNIDIDVPVGGNQNV